ncbi:MAG: hypothetical protein UIB63_06160 [Methanobrevibacter sp.]|uniref:hypothetical protein n=1 Tax=Methanobrevibacter sp. TaxID=66852 RepID=UPI002E78DDA6|nr:hypothetical protein [Methanobrevibacter sp.]MEE0942675.1 hypothetical protein [Methanobrevibacter sp.]
MLGTRGLEKIIFQKFWGIKVHELVECIKPEVRKGRLYRLNDKGDDVVKNLE